MFLNDESVQDEVLNCNARAHGDDCLEDFCDGSIVKSHELFSTDPNALQIIGYYDELEIVNPLGAYVKKKSRGFVFFFLQIYTQNFDLVSVL